MFASTYICEQTFSTLKRANPVSRARLSDDHLHSILRINVTKLEPNIEKLVSEKQHQPSHSYIVSTDFVCFSNF